jgi:hypothetical protein
MHLLVFAYILTKYAVQETKKKVTMLFRETALPLPFIRLPEHALFPDSVVKCTDVSRTQPSFEIKQADPA